MEGHLVWWCQRDVFYNVLIFSSAIFLFASSILVYKLNLAALGPLFVLVHLPLLWLLFVGDGTVKNTNSLSPTGKGLSLESHGDLTSHVLYSISGTLCAFVAFFIYKKNIPEKWNPGYFDLFGSSHNWWHIFTWLGPTFVLQGLFKFMVYRVEGIGQHCAAN
jgi:predicted membrane channel-forming protein YqfA (hemolysin III family)